MDRKNKQIKGFLSFPHHILDTKKAIKDCALSIYIHNSMKMNLTYAYIFLVIAIIFELISTSTLKDTLGFTKLYPSLIVVIALCICLYLISHSMQFIPVGIVYASWAAGGIVGITIIAALKYNQIPNIPTVIGLSLIVVGVIIVHLMNDIDVK